MNTILKLSDYLNEVYPLPYYFDIVHYEYISNENLKKHIDTYGKEIYIKIIFSNVEIAKQFLKKVC